MLIFDQAKAAQIIEAHKNRPQPEFIVKSKKSVVHSRPSTDNRPQSTVDSRPLTVGHGPSTLLQDCRAEYKALRLEQAQISNTIYDVVNSGATRQELKDLYEKIESYRPGLVDLYRRIRHVEQYGTLPVEQVVNDVPVDIYLLKDQRKRLIDERCKLKAKIAKGHLKPSKVQAWQLRLDEVDAEYVMADEKIKKMEGK